MGTLMPSEIGTAIVIALYGLCLIVIWVISPRLPGAALEVKAPFWRNTRVWASFVAVAQMVVYLVFS